MRTRRGARRVRLLSQIHNLVGHEGQQYLPRLKEGFGFGSVDDDKATMTENLLK